MKIYTLQMFPEDIDITEQSYHYSNYAGWLLTYKSVLMELCSWCTEGKKRCSSSNNWNGCPAPY
ncbi:hypothetical protein Syun_020987 [Stephania yunnanensis]|uniref:Uncharacterized protein n=1 Tax=Stephania yunnanensis TaxID=152371 RepID=A0AAP0NQK6_9MAGN